MGKPLVALMQPSSGLRAPHRGAVEAFLRPTRRGTDRVEFKQGTSMLPRCFNLLWADVLNAFNRGTPITHVAMIHDDVAPDQQGGFCDWLDVLVDELDRTGADLVSAVVPIKNGRGVTSTAVEVNPAAPWNPRRLTLHEVFRLPETFGAEDIPWNTTGGCLLINTGLWVARFDPRWADPADREHKVVFRFVNDIIRTPDGVWASTDLPEDWEFARDLHRQGKRCVATRRVKLEHEIPLYHNRSAWGDWPTDVGWLGCSSAWLDASRRAAGDDAWRFPEDVDGWLTQTEGRALAELAAGKEVLEVGSYCGRSTVCLAQTANRVVAVDPFDGRATERPRDTMAEVLENLSRYGVFQKTTVMRGLSQDVLPQLEPGGFDLAFIDGNHTEDAVLRDAELAAPLLKPGGLLAFHDYRDAPDPVDGRWDPGVTAAVNALVRGGAELVALHGSVAVVRPARTNEVKSNGEEARRDRPVAGKRRRGGGGGDNRGRRAAAGADA